MNREFDFRDLKRSREKKRRGAAVVPGWGGRLSRLWRLWAADGVLAGLGLSPLKLALVLATFGTVAFAANILGWRGSRPAARDAVNGMPSLAGIVDTIHTHHGSGERSIGYVKAGGGWDDSEQASGQAATDTNAQAQTPPSPAQPEDANVPSGANPGQLVPDQLGADGAGGAAGAGFGGKDIFGGGGARLSGGLGGFTSQAQIQSRAGGFRKDLINSVLARNVGGRSSLGIHRDAVLHPLGSRLLAANRTSPLAGQTIGAEGGFATSKGGATAPSDFAAGPAGGGGVTGPAGAGPGPGGGIPTGGGGTGPGPGGGPGAGTGTGTGTGTSTGGNPCAAGAAQAGANNALEQANALSGQARQYAAQAGQNLEGAAQGLNQAFDGAAPCTAMTGTGTGTGTGAGGGTSTDTSGACDNYGYCGGTLTDTGAACPTCPVNIGAVENTTPYQGQADTAKYLLIAGAVMLAVVYGLALAAKAFPPAAGALLAIAQAMVYAILAMAAVATVMAGIIGFGYGQTMQGLALGAGAVMLGISAWQALGTVKDLRSLQSATENAVTDETSQAAKDLAAKSAPLDGKLGKEAALGGLSAGFGAMSSITGSLAPSPAGGGAGNAQLQAAQDQSQTASANARQADAAYATAKANADAAVAAYKANPTAANLQAANDAIAKAQAAGAQANAANAAAQNAAQAMSNVSQSAGASTQGSSGAGRTPQGAATETVNMNTSGSANGSSAANGSDPEQSWQDSNSSYRNKVNSAG